MVSQWLLRTSGWSGGDSHWMQHPRMSAFEPWRLAILGIVAVPLFSVAQFFPPPFELYLMDSHRVTSAWTACSFLCLFACFVPALKRYRTRFLAASCCIQMASVCLLSLGVTPGPRYFVPSSVVTSAYLLTVTFCLWLTTERILKSVSVLLFPLTTLVPLCLLWAAMFAKYDYLGVQPEMEGVGTSTPTVVLSLILAAVVHLAFYRTMSLRALRSESKPMLFFAFLVFVIFATGFVYRSEVVVGFIGVLLVILVAFFFAVVRPSLIRRDEIVTVCAWTQQVQLPDGRWVKMDELLSQFGFTVSHGIHPDVSLHRLHALERTKTPRSVS